MSEEPTRQDKTEHSVHIERITPAIARQYLGYNVHNRNLRKRVVAAYAEDMENGDWEWNGEAIKFDVHNALLDGQHRLAAIIESGTPIEMMVVRGLPSLTQETMDTGAKRTFGDVLKLRGEDQYTILASTIRAIASWEAGYRTGNNAAKSFTNRQLIKTLDDYPWVRNGVTSISRVSRSTGLPSSVAGVLWWAFMRIDAEDCHFFFERLASAENHSAGEPVYELRKFLDLNRENTRGSRNLRYLMAVSIKAWNKFRFGEPVGQLRFRAGGANPETFPEPK